MMDAAGQLTRISGAVIEAEVRGSCAMGEAVRVGDQRLLAEVIALQGSQAVAQVYEDTAGLAPGDPFFASGDAVCAELGPGLLGHVFDGIQRPLAALAAAHGDFLTRGAHAPALDRDRLWQFEPRIEKGAAVSPGAMLGLVAESFALEHRILVPPGVQGEVVEIASAGPHRVEDVVARIRTGHGEQALPLFQKWRVRAPRPFAARLPPTIPMITGQRVLDTFFPIPLGGAAGMPGGFGTGKTVLQHQLCKWSDADVIVYVGCGERGNEITRMLRELPELIDPRTGRPLSERTVIVANTSNMPVSARESSIYTGVTIAEYYRDMGYRVALLADSTSRWAEALREISGRLGEMPAEEGYPPYLESRLAAFYERAGRVTTLNGSEGAVTIISAISPPGGDLTEPVTRHTQSFTRTFWTLDKDLASERFFPAVSVSASYGEVPPELAEWWDRAAGAGWAQLRGRALALLAEASRLAGTARLVGTESLPERQRFVLAAAGLIEEGFLQQSAFDPREARDDPPRQLRLLKALLHFADRGLQALERGVPEKKLLALPFVALLKTARSRPGEPSDSLESEIDRSCEALEAETVPRGS